MHARPTGNRHVRSWVCVLPPNKPMKLPVAFGARSLSAKRSADHKPRLLMSLSEVLSRRFGEHITVSVGPEAFTFTARDE